MSIRTRIAISGGAVILIALLVFDLVLLGLFNHGQTDDLDRSLKVRANDAAKAISTMPFPPGQPLAPLDLRRSANSGETFIEVFDAAGAAISSTGAVDGSPPAITLDVLSRIANAQSPATVKVNGLGLRVVALAWRRADLGQSGFVVAGQPAARIAQQRRGFAILLLLSSAFILAAAGVASWWAAGRALKPLKAIASATDRIAETDDLSRRLPVPPRTDEIGRLATSFNGLLGRVQGSQRRLMESLETQQRFVADASHELRTPLTTIRSNAGFLLARPDVRPVDREAALQDIADESERMSRLVEDLLALARADAGQQLVRTPLDLRPLVRDVARQAQSVHVTRGIRLAEPEGSAAILLDGNRDALTQLLWILIDNAVKHTQRGGLVAIDVKFANGAAVMSVRDDGPGIPVAELDRIFERFFQSDRARSASGAGLGLAIARWIVEQHEGRIAARNEPDGGAVFTVELPVAARPNSLNS